MEEFVPDTFCMDVKAERDAFFSQHEGITVNVISTFPFLSICVADCKTGEILTSTPPCPASGFLGIKHFTN